MRATYIFLAAATGLAAAAWYSAPRVVEAPRCVLAPPQQVRALYDRYAAVLHRADAEALAALYSPDAVLMGPGDRRVRLGRAEIAAYYSEFLKHKPMAVLVDRNVQSDCAGLAETGTEILTLHPPAVDDGKAVPNRSWLARYALSYRWFGDQWLIVHHHQELAGYPADDPLAATVSSRETGEAALVTSATVPAREDIALPGPTYRLPSSPPVILSAHRSLLPLAPEATAIDAAAIERMRAATRDLVASVAPSAPVAVTVPRVAFSLGFGAPLVPPPEKSPEAPAAAAPASQPVQAADGYARQDAPSPEQSAHASPPPAPFKPAVAGFTQRADPEPVPAEKTVVPPAAAAALPPVVQHAPAKAAAAKSRSRPATKDAAAKTGKFLGWVDQRPIWDD